MDVGRRRIGLALSDDSAVLARPWQTIDAGANPAAAADAVDRLVRGYLEQAGEPPLAGIVVGLPRRLNGEDTDATPMVRAFAAALEARSPGIAVYLQDERLTSHEAESRLAERERDWRARKKKLDAAAAAIILQDFLDGRPQ